MTAKRRYLPLLLPLASLVLSGALVGFQYYRRERLTRELAAAEREMKELQQHLPSPPQIEKPRTE